MKKVLHTIDTTGPGGAETVFVQLADRLRDHGYESVVVIRGPGWVQSELQRRSLHPFVVRSDRAFDWNFLAALVRIVRAENVDLIQSHLLGSNVYCAAAGLLTTRPVVATFHGMVDVGADERLRWLKFQLMNAGVARFVAVSGKLLEAIRQGGLINPNKTDIIYNGVDLSRYRDQPRHNDLRNQLRLPDDTALIGSLGNVRPAKGYEFLIHAARRVIDQFPNAHFVIAGDVKRPLMGALEDLIAQCGVGRNVHFLGYVDDSAGFLAQLNIFVLSSTSEGFSISTIEAMASGLPIVVTRCGGPEEIVTPDVTGLVVPPGDSNAIADAILLLFWNRPLASRLACAAKTQVALRFGMDTMLKQYIALYHRHV